MPRRWPLVVALLAWTGVWGAILAGGAGRDAFRHPSPGNSLLFGLGIAAVILIGASATLQLRALGRRRRAPAAAIARHALASGATWILVWGAAAVMRRAGNEWRLPETDTSAAIITLLLLLAALVLSIMVLLVAGERYRQR